MRPKVASAPLTAGQIRAGRALADMSQQALANASGLSLSTIRDYESERRGGALGGAQAIRRSLENEGIEFLPGSPEAGPGVRLKSGMPAVLRRPSRLVNEVLLIPTEWQGREFSLVVSREVLEDLGQIPGEHDPTAAEYVALFEQHRALILTAATVAIKGGRITPDNRVYIVTSDIPELA